MFGEFELFLAQIEPFYATYGVPEGPGHGPAGASAQGPRWAKIFFLGPKMSKNRVTQRGPMAPLPRSGGIRNTKWRGTTHVTPPVAARTHRDPPGGRSRAHWVQKWPPSNWYPEVNFDHSLPNEADHAPAKHPMTSHNPASSLQSARPPQMTFIPLSASSVCDTSLQV